MTEKVQEAAAERPNKAVFDYGSTLVMGLVFGMIAGMLLGDTGFGLAMGLGVANIIGAVNEKRQQKAGADAAIAISLVGMLIVLLIFVLT